MALWKAGGEVEIKRENLDHGIVEGRGGKVAITSWNLDHVIVKGRGEI